MPGGGWRLTRPTKPKPQTRQAQRHRAMTAGTEPLYAGWQLAPYPAYKTEAAGPASTAPPGDDSGHGAALCRVAAGA